jgi:hypothetical protein
MLRCIAALLSSQIELLSVKTRFDPGDLLEHVVEMLAGIEATKLCQRIELQVIEPGILHHPRGLSNP